MHKVSELLAEPASGVLCNLDPKPAMCLAAVQHFATRPFYGTPADIHNMQLTHTIHAHI